MGAIHEEHVEWAVVNRMKRMLETPRNDFSVTETFALFSTIVLWSKNRAWTHESTNGQSDVAARSVRTKLAETLILERPWSLSSRLPAWERGSLDRMATPVEINADFKGMTAEQFFKWLRDALAHGDGRTVRPLHRPSRDWKKEWLGGFEIEFKETRRSQRKLLLTLTKDDMRRLGGTLADAFCTALSGNHDFAQYDDATKLVEADLGNAA
ncbi:MAG TPA: hypothetical protein VMU59_11100 [Caulobacteraceae bacterium]|nr:hypothetical protein [Caulobacteraceae bacterium]